jgi:hypothetical protein
MTITRNRHSKTIVSESIERMSVEGYTIGRIAQILGVSEQLVYIALQGEKVGPVNEKAAQYYMAWRDSERLLDDAKKEVQRVQDNIALNGAERDSEARSKLEATINEQAATIVALKAALRSLI